MYNRALTVGRSLSILLKSFISITRKASKKGQSRKSSEVDSASILKEQRKFDLSWKLCLNLCSWK